MGAASQMHKATKEETKWLPHDSNYTLSAPKIGLSSGAVIGAVAKMAAVLKINGKAAGRI